MLRGKIRVMKCVPKILRFGPRLKDLPQGKLVRSGLLSKLMEASRGEGGGK